MSSDRSPDSDPDPEPPPGRTTAPAFDRNGVEARGGSSTDVPSIPGVCDEGYLLRNRYARGAELAELSWLAFDGEPRERNPVFVPPEDAADADDIGELGNRPDG